MRPRTRQNPVNWTLQTTAIEVLGPNRNRKAFLLTPVAGGTTGTPIVAVPFAPGNNQPWQVPNGVTQVVDMYCWGAGGQSGAAGASLGGGGGGGGSFATTGPLAVTPGSVFLISVDAASGGTQTQIFNPSGTLVAKAGSGANAVTSAAGTGGTASTGGYKEAGGSGFASTTLGGNGGGGGGAAGAFTPGVTATTQAGAAGSGTAQIAGYGAGGAGGNGSVSNVAGVAGTTPGGGGGGGGATTGAVGAGGAGLAVVFYEPSTAAQAISLSPASDQAGGNQKLITGAGTLNFTPGLVSPFLLSDFDVGSAIENPWWAISGVAGAQIQITEYVHEVDPWDLGALLSKLAGC